MQVTAEGGDKGELIGGVAPLPQWLHGAYLNHRLLQGAPWTHALGEEKADGAYALPVKHHQALGSKHSPPNRNPHKPLVELVRELLVVLRGLVALVHGGVACLARLSLDLGQIRLGQLDILFVLGQQLLGGVFREATLDHLLNLQRLDSQQVQNHVVRQAELGPQLGRLAEYHVAQLPCGRHIARAPRRHDDDGANSVQAAPTCAAGHLSILAGQ